jgi:hypothetical protein
VPEDLPLFCVEKEGATHERKRIMLLEISEVKFKLFIIGITAKKWRPSNALLDTEFVRGSRLSLVPQGVT